MDYLRHEYAMLALAGRSNFIGTRRCGKPCAIGFREGNNGQLFVDLKEAYAVFAPKSESPNVVIIYFCDNGWPDYRIIAQHGGTINFHTTYEKVLEQLSSKFDGHLIHGNDYVLPDNYRDLRSLMCSMEDVGVNNDKLYVTTYLPKDYIVLGKVLNVEEDGQVDDSVWYGADYGRDGFGYHLFPDIQLLINSCDENQRLAIYIATAPIELQGDVLMDKQCGGYFRIHNNDTSNCVNHIMTDEAPSVQMWLSNNCVKLTERISEVRKKII